MFTVGMVALAFSGWVVRPAPARAAGTITFDGSPGTGAPPATLGPYTMARFSADPQPVGAQVTGVATPSGNGTVGFTPALQHLQVGNGWATWSNGYTGDVYSTNGGDGMTFTLPAGTNAFYFYAEPDPFATFTMTATAQDGTTSGPIAVNGFAGAQYFGFYTDGSVSLKSIQVSSGIDFAVGEFGIGTSISYVALGDSYSSGEGAPPFFAGTDGPADFCHRSVNAYSQVLGQAYNVTPKFYACSGAVTANITSQFRFGEPPQITDPGVDNTASLITMSIGGNDAGFADVLTSCIEQKLKADVVNALIGPVAVWLGLGLDPSCANSQSFVNAANTRIDNVSGPAQSTYQALEAATSPTDTSIIAAGYPHLFPDSSSEQSCLALSSILTTQDEQYFNQAGDRLDGVLENAAAQAGVNFVDVRAAFGGHAICGNAGAWINGISFASGSGQPCAFSVLGHCIWSGLPIVGSFHPNASGQSGGYAAAIQAYINAATNLTPEGFPVNPDPPAAAPVHPALAPQTPSVVVGTLVAQPVTQGSADCAGTYQAGQTLTASGGGFAPGAAVSFYVTSPGLGTTSEQLAASQTAGPDGTASATFRIPLAGTGFTPAGASAGPVFVDAIGTGPDGSHVDDIASAGLAPHTSPCGTVEPFPFTGFNPPVANPPEINTENPGRTIPVKFTLTGSSAVLSQVLAAGYPQSAPVSCTAPEQLTTGDPTTATSPGNDNPGDDYNYLWKTDKSWTGCRELIVKLVDGTYHRAVFDFG